MISTQRFLLALSVLTAAAAAPSGALAQQKPGANPVAQATLLGQYADWGAYTAQPGGRKVCFAISRPTSKQENPPNRRSDEHGVFMFVSTRPAEKVVNEVSLLITNYAFNNSDATLALGGTNFPLQTQNDGAWTKNAGDESKLVDAMRKGSDLVVRATTSRGTQTIDTFSLKGISQALDRVAQECK